MNIKNNDCPIKMYYDYTVNAHGQRIKQLQRFLELENPDEKLIKDTYALVFGVNTTLLDTSKNKEIDKDLYNRLKEKYPEEFI